MWVSVAVAVVGLIGAGVSAYGSYAAGENAEEAADYNAKRQERAAADALQRGSVDAAQIKERTRKLIATQIANSGASGFDTSTGTPLDLSVEAKGYGELDALTTINNAQRVGAGGKAQAELDRFQGRAASSAGTIGAAGTLISGASNGYYGYKKGMLAKTD